MWFDFGGSLRDCGVYDMKTHRCGVAGGKYTLFYHIRRWGSIFFCDGGVNFSLFGINLVKSF